MEQQYASFASDDLTSGLPDDFRGTIVAAKCIRWVPKEGQAAKPAVHFQVRDETGKVHDVYYSAGKDFTGVVPSEDGDGFVAAPGKSKAQIAQTSNWGVATTEAENAGMPKERLRTGRVSQWLGLDAQWKRKIVKGFTTKAGEKVEDRDVLAPSRIFAQPGGGAVAMNTSLGNGQPASVQVTPQGNGATQGNGAGAQDAVVQATISAVLQELAKAGGTLTRAQVPATVYQATEGNPFRAQILQTLAQGDAFYKQPGLPFKFDGSTLSL